MTFPSIENNHNKDLWELIEEEYSEGFSVENFRQLGGFNERLGSWGPISNNSRYFKSLLSEFANLLDKRFIEALNIGLNEFLSKIKHKDIGKPTNIFFKGSPVNIDYLLSAEEILFLFRQLTEVQSILEIGPGFGRLPHSILQYFRNIKKYYVVDLDFMLSLQKDYLGKALSKQMFNKIEFLTPQEMHNIPSIELTINIDSFQEIKPNLVSDYLDFISKKSNFFFSKNAACKYHPSSVDISEFNQEQYSAALQMGLCREVVDIYNDESLKIAKENYVKAYCPEDMKMLKSQDCYGQYHYYHSVLYQRLYK
tara:strand:+ start:273 stop:1202 length:930 start_codon:yes stop_codon:yes gene_type:complete